MYFVEHFKALCGKRWFFRSRIPSIIGRIVMSRTSICRSLTLFFIVLCFSFTGRSAVAAPPAPSPISPSDGSIVTQPFIISWTAVSDPAGIVAYNWQVSSSSAFTSVLLQSSTNGAAQDTVSGLADGTYFWRAQAVNGDFVQGAWSQPSSFTVNGTGAGAPGTPSLGPTQGYSTFHPFETMTFNWSAVPGASSYLLEYSTDSSFPVLSSGQFDNIPNTTFSFAIADPQGNYFARVYAVDANGVLSAPSNVITFSVFYNNPLPPPPSPVAPVNNPTLTLPVTIEWTHVPNPQSGGYELQIARDSAFSSIEVDDPQLNGPTRNVLSLTSGKKFWRVRSAQGDSSPTTAAVTAWSATGTFTISSAPPTPVSVTLAKDPLYSGETTLVAVQLTSAAPAGGASINFNSSNPSVVPVPATISMPGNTAWTQFQLQAGQVTAPTPVTLTATLNSGTASAQFTLQPPSLKSITISPSTITGGAQPQGIVMLNGQAPAGGATVTLTSSSPSVSPPASVLVDAGSFSASFPISTNAVSANTPVTVTASYGGASAQAQVTLTPQQPPSSLTLSPTSTTGTDGSFGTVAIASPSSTDQILQVASSNPAVASVPNSVFIPSGSTTGGFNIFTSSVSTQTIVTISVSGAGVTRTANLTVNATAPAPPPTPGAPTLLSPSDNAKVGQPITFDWSDVANATSYEIQIDDSQNFTAPLTFSQTVNVSQATVTGLPAQRLFWRVRAFNSADVAGRFSTSRRFTAGAVSTPPPPSPASLSAVSVSPTSVVGGNTSQGKVTLTGAAPSGGALVSVSSANQSVAAVPASVTVAAGASSVTFNVTTSTVTVNTSVVITATYNGVSRTTTLTVTPASSTPPPSTDPLPAPSLVSPAADARFSPGASITFDWTDVSGAASYTIQIDDSDTFSSPIVNQNTTVSQFTTTLPTTRMWWRVRANSSSGTPGNWSSARRFEVKQ
jgi:hypothetical protein